jgi:hypothetical protein
LSHQRWVITAMAAVLTWRHRAWRYNIVSAAQPVTDRENAQQRSADSGHCGGAGAASRCPGRRCRAACWCGRARRFHGGWWRDLLLDSASS